MKTNTAKHTPMITLAKGGYKERTVKLESLQIPDAWGFAVELKKTDLRSGQALDELWHLAHDLKRHALEQEEIKADLLAALEGLLEAAEHAEPNFKHLWNARWNEAHTAIAKARGEL